MRTTAVAVALVLSCAGRALGQAAPPGAAASPAPEPAAWSFTASALTYVLPDERNYLQPTFTADGDWLHLEVRYNYEDLETASVWMGYNVGGGTSVTWELTPMLGGVFGGTNGIAPGLRGSLAWWKLDFYGEAEYVFDAAGSEDSFFYSWSELSLAPVEWLRVGLVTQRTRVYEMGRDLQRGVLAGVTLGRLEVTAYVLDPDLRAPVVVVAASVSF